MTAPTGTRAAQIAAVAERLAARDHEAACAAWDARDHNVDRRALLTWAENWTDWHAEFRAHGLTADQADTVLYDAVWVWTHPAARSQLVFLVAVLREAVDRLRALRGGLLDPCDVHDGPCWVGSRQEIAESLLYANVDEALLPLLYGRTA